MSVQTNLVEDGKRRIQNEFSGKPTRNEAVASVEWTIQTLSEQASAIPVVAVIHPKTNVLGMIGMLYETQLIDALKTHPKLAELIAVDMASGQFGSTFKSLVRIAGQRGAGITVLNTLADLDKHLGI
jgi:NADPH-dependent curcumin reductase CurA